MIMYDNVVDGDDEDDDDDDDDFAEDYLHSIYW